LATVKKLGCADGGNLMKGAFVAALQPLMTGLGAECPECLIWAEPLAVFLVNQEVSKLCG
jgi:hypothetical protein